MIINIILLAVCVSIDSLGIGLTYGIKDTKISFYAKILLCVISFVFAGISILFGYIISNFLTEDICKIIGTIILCGMGIWIINQSADPFSFDVDKSNKIDSKEAIFLGIALSLDSIGIGIGSGIIGINSFIFPIFVSIFHLLFLFLGNFLGKKIKQISNIPQNIWSIVSGILLIIIGIAKIIN